MQATGFLKTVHAALIAYQRQQPSPKVARIVTAIEREIQEVRECPYCHRAEGERC